MSSPSRYSGYTPLWSDFTALKQKSRRNAYPALIALALASALLNIYLMHRLTITWPPVSLDNYRPLSTQPLVTEEVYRTLNRPTIQENAIVTSLFSDSFATAIATLGHSLNRVNSTAQHILFFLEESVSPEALCIATASGFIAHPVPRIPPPHNGRGTYGRFIDAYSKLNIWSLDTAGIKSVVHLDADTLVLRNFDELFSLPYNFAAVPDVYADAPGFKLDFNSGVVFARTSTEVFHDMMNKMHTASFDPHDADQGFLNQYFAADVVRLPYEYNANLAIKKRKPEMWSGIKKQIRIVHYTLVKPFISEKDNSGKKVVDIHKIAENVQDRMGEYDGAFEEELREWLEMWNDTYRTYKDILTSCARIHDASRY